MRNVTTADLLVQGGLEGRFVDEEGAVLAGLLQAAAGARIAAVDQAPAAAVAEHQAVRIRAVLHRH